MTDVAARSGAPIRVLMGIPAAGATGGGPALHLPMLVEDLRALGHAVETFPFGRWAEGEPLALKIAHQALDLVRFPGRVARARGALVHLNSSFDRKALARDVPFALLSRLLGRRVLVKWHGSETDLLASRAPLWRALTAALFRLVDGVAVLSREEEAAVRRRQDAPDCRVVCNGLDLGRYVGRPPVRPRLGVPAAAPLVLFIGRLIPAKGLQEVVQALPDLAARHGARLVVAGDGPARAPAAALAERLKVASCVHWLGRITEDEAADWYCGCDVLAFPTYHAEGFPMTVFQSMAGGLGIVTTRARATADHLREPENCLFVPPRDPAALGRALDRLLGDAELLRRMRDANRAAAARFDRVAVARQWSRIYAGLGSGRDREEDR